MLGALLVAPARPFVAVVGGAKVADKLGVLRALLTRVDTLVVGGGMAFSFLAAQGHRVGASLVDAGHVEGFRALLEESGGRILLPTRRGGARPRRGTLGEDTAGRGGTRPFGFGDPRRVGRGLDIGPETRGSLRRHTSPRRGRCSGTGPWGSFEDNRFASGDGHARHGHGRPPGLHSGRGRRQRWRPLDHMSLGNDIDYVSTGGGASLELLEHERYCPVSRR